MTFRHFIRNSVRVFNKTRISIDKSFCLPIKLFKTKMEVSDNQIQNFEEFEDNMNELIKENDVTRLERGLIQVTILSQPFNRYLTRNNLSVGASKFSWNHILLTYLIANTVRLVWCLTLPDDHPLLIHFGDFTQWFGGRRIYFLLPFILININVSYQSLIYSMSNERDFIWIKVFASLKGKLNTK